ncbi:hypothetical protein [Ferrimicrobium sp.]|uniref:hypothetical protein n=1 Tax=Ferrimicrobium sp. TaxID=2926050 RepID=UPI00262BB611|nr:hypothetical protein [Ferrimicrobium sp.]
MTLSSDENMLVPTDAIELVQRELDDAKRRAETLRLQVAEANEQVESLEVTLRVLGNLIGTRLSNKRTVRSNSETPLQEVPVSTKAPSLSEAVQIVMRTRPTHDWNAAEIEAELTNQDWMPTGTKPMATLRAALFRLNRGGVIENVERGRYRLAGVQTPLESTPHHESAHVERLNTNEGGSAYPLAM